MKPDDSNSPKRALQPKNKFFTILVVDGDLSFTAFLEEFFATDGNMVMKAESVAEALAKTREYQPDLILMSSQMEGSEGLTLLGELLMEQVSAAVIVMAGKPNASEAVEAMKMGAVDYLERPVDPEKLKQAINNQKALYKMM